MRGFLDSVRRASLEGFGFGALLYGTVIAWLHILHNRLDSVADALVTYGFLACLYGLWAAVLFGGIALLGTAFRSVVGRSSDEDVPAVFFPGILFFHLVFWELFFLYGLTYGQAPSFARGGPWAMVFYLGLAALGIAIGAFLLSVLLVGVWRRCVQADRHRWVAVGLLAIGVVVSGGLPFLFSGGRGAAQEGQAFGIAVRDTGIDVVFVGLDGADWQVLQPMIDAGELPHFAEMQARGVSAALETLPDANSAVIWATMFSGLERQRHGVEDFYRIELPGLGNGGLYPVHRVFFKELTNLLEPLGVLRRTLVTRYSHRGVPWWEVADQAGLSTGVVDGYLMSFPAYRPLVEDSYFVSYGADSFAASLAQRGAQDVELFLQPPTLFRELRKSLESGGDFVWQSNVLRQLLESREQPRLVTFYTHEPDSAQHKTWKWFEPERYLGVSEEAVALRGDEIPQLHRDFDVFLGQLREAVGPETVIVVASDHGHSPTLVHKLYTQHRHGPPGILLMEGGPIRAGSALADADVYDLFPTILHLLGLPVPEDGPGRVLENALDPGFQASFPVETIPSYDFLDPGLAGAGAMDQEQNRRELEKLKSLGYI